MQLAVFNPILHQCENRYTDNYHLVTLNDLIVVWTQYHLLFQPNPTPICIPETTTSLSSWPYNKSDNRRFSPSSNESHDLVDFIFVWQDQYGCRSSESSYDARAGTSCAISSCITLNSPRLENQPSLKPATSDAQPLYPGLSPIPFIRNTKSQPLSF